MSRRISPMIGRRGLLGAAAVAAIPRAAFADVTSSVPQVSRRDIQPDMVALGNSILSFPNNTTNDTTSNTLNTRSQRWTPNRSGVTDVQFGFTGSLMRAGAAETDFPIAYTVKGAIEYPAGTLTPVFWNGGATTAVVNPGRTEVLSDPCPIFIPAGTAFFVKIWVQWSVGSFYLNPNLPYAGDWCIRGTDLTDDTVNTTARVPTTSGTGFSPMVYGRLTSKVPSLGIVGESISWGYADAYHNVYGTRGYIRGLRNEIPWIGCHANSTSLATFLSRQEGVSQAMRDKITHLIMHWSNNDIAGGASLATLQANFTSVVESFLSRGVKVFANTVFPRTTSTDHFATAVNQTVNFPSTETTRLGFNNWLRTGAGGLPLAGILDEARAVDPTDSGLWGFDAGGTFPTTTDASGTATISGGAVTGVSVGGLFGSPGNGYPINSTMPILFVNYPGTPGSGAAGTATVGGGGFVTTWTITAGGSGYTFPPMAVTSGPWTLDGIHPFPRGMAQLLQSTGFTPDLFV